MNIDTDKIITITYNDLDSLFNREEDMLKTLQNYLNREKDYEYVETYISQTENKFKLNFKIRLRD